MNGEELLAPRLSTELVGRVASIVTNATKQEILSWLKLRDENCLVAAIEDLVRKKRIVEPESNVRSNMETKVQPQKRKVAIATQTV